MYYSTIATKFRSAFDTIDLTNAPGFLPNFPKGCCGWATCFIGNYLQLVRAQSPLHILARHPGKGYGHEWIEIEGVILDITLDQFDPAFQLSVTDCLPQSVASQWRSTPTNRFVLAQLGMARFHAGSYLAHHRGRAAFPSGRAPPPMVAGSGRSLLDA